MPNGRVLRIDSDRGRVHIVRRGRGYEADLSEVDSAARVPSARVSFRLRRTNGHEIAEQVQLREGARTSKRQRRFGDLTGARQPGSKVWTTAQGAFGVDVTTQPLRVVSSWLDAIEGQDLDGAVSLYRPSAVVHTDTGEVSGRRAIRGHLESLTGPPEGEPQVRGMDRYVLVDWTRNGKPVRWYLLVDNGQICEQWLNGAPPESLETISASDIELVTKGNIAHDAAAYGRKKLEALSSTIAPSPRSIRLKLSQAADHVVDRPSIAEASIEVDGSLIRASAPAATMTEAVDRLMDRLKSRIDLGQNHRSRDPRRMVPPPGEWRHGNLASHHPPYFDRPVEERELVRHKSFAPDEMTIEEAAWDMELLDYDFFLFTDAFTGADTLLKRAPELVSLQKLASDSHDGDGASMVEPNLDLPSGVVEEAMVPPRLGVGEAITYLDGTDERSLFFENEQSGRGNVVYRRYDGHYGLITPASVHRE